MFVPKLSRVTSLTLLAALLLTGCSMGGATAEPTVDVNAINTAAVATAMEQLSAQLTQTALAAPSPTSPPTDTPASLPTALLPTSAVASPTGGAGALPTLSFNTTPVAGFTQIASPVAPVATTSLGDACNNNVFEGDVTIPDNSIVKPGEDFVKQWAIRNTGSCTWDDGYQLVITNNTSDCQAMDAVNFVFRNSDDFVSPNEAINIGVNLTAPLQPATYQCAWRMQSDTGAFFGTPLTVIFEVRN
ncbi:MAG TPA: NBR1-Ig-like domain-containing protein [Anaerolineales bacterium]|nr:NBR1-Ig-like domain-containing protein [Anaerolineales bacterium]